MSPLANKPNLLYTDLTGNEYTSILPLRDSIKLQTLYIGSEEFPIPIEQAKEIIPQMKDLDWYVGPSDQELAAQCHYINNLEELEKSSYVAVYDPETPFIK